MYCDNVPQCMLDKNHSLRLWFVQNGRGRSKEVWTVLASRGVRSGGLWIHRCGQSQSGQPRTLQPNHAGVTQHRGATLSLYLPLKKNWILPFVSILQTFEQRQVTHFQFLSWPDYGVPSSAVSLIDFLGAVKHQQQWAVQALGSQWRGHPLGPPMVVHCSAGIGRTG